MEQLPRLYLSRDETLKRVARFKDLKGFDGGLPESNMPGCEPMLFNAIGGDGPRAEFTDQAMAQLQTAGVWSPERV
jgi:hypothetical protein